MKYHILYTQCLRKQDRYFTVSIYLFWLIRNPPKCYKTFTYTYTCNFSKFLDYEGKTGMAAIVLKRYHTFNGEKLYKHMEALLPSYAKPRFVRIMVRPSVVSHLYLSSVWFENWSLQSCKQNYCSYDCYYEEF